MSKLCPGVSNPANRPLHFLLLVLAAALSLTGCAEGVPDTDPVDQGGGSDGGRTDGGVDQGPGDGALCDVCTGESDCPDDADCVPFGSGSLCMRQCPTAEFQGCPSDFECGSILASGNNNLYCLPTEGCCVDEDGDNYGQGESCLGPDCNDTPAYRDCVGAECNATNDQVLIVDGDPMQTPQMGSAIYPNADEYCDGIDQDCNDVLDNSPVDCAMQGCDEDGSGGYQQTASAACISGTCETPNITTCERFACVDGGSAGDICSGVCVVAGQQNDAFCRASAHCEEDAGCQPDRVDGSTCVEDSDCQSDHCENGFCCADGDCCSETSDCPGGGTGIGQVCNDSATCQGTEGVLACNSSFQCETMSGVQNDSACTATTQANGCGAYPSVFCDGGADQTPPDCPSTCALDQECDDNAHCEAPTCELDLPNGSACDENSDCISAHCQNGFCCASGDCCAAATDCSAYESPSTCTDVTGCQGFRTDATCNADNQCESVVNVPDDSGCDDTTESDSCQLFPSVFCDGTEMQMRPQCLNTCTGDGDCDPEAHCEAFGGGVAFCLPDQVDGSSCDEPSDCISGFCGNGFCCSGGPDCCSSAGDCPSSYSTDSVCGDATSCQGTRNVATCTANVCGTNVGFPDDSACDSSVVASNCGTFPDAVCSGDMSQSGPSCANACSDADPTTCDANAHCDNGTCALDFPDGSACDEPSDCISGYCNNGFCCSGGTCCNDETACGSFATPPTCNSSSSSNNDCQGTRVDAVCTNSQCSSTAPIQDDRGCGAGQGITCTGGNPNQTCDGTEDQTAPVCSTGCSDDSECLSGFHCDTVCVPDVTNGGSCDENSDCTSDFCSGGFCCGGSGADVCCSADINCSGGTSPVCDNTTTCQGTRTDAVCTNNICALQPNVPDDSACSSAFEANTCGLFPSEFCTGAEDQPVPVCDNTCTDDLECDSDAHCDAPACIGDLADGQVCDENSDCQSANCANGYCCSGTDCCSVAANCPASYTIPASCDDDATCQGTRGVPTCVNSVCGTTIEEYDTACGLTTLADDCGPYPSEFCSGIQSQGTPVCNGSCSNDGGCDSDAYCGGGLCRPDEPDGGSCTLDSQCVSGHCQNGYCCSGGDCCATVLDCQAPGLGYQSAATCDVVSQCQGTRDDATCVNNVCGSNQNIPDDRACTAGVQANDCGVYPAINCNGAEEQTPPTCSAMCTSDGDCDAVAHCSGVGGAPGMCVGDFPDGTMCAENSDCSTNNCGNGFCCSSGDCCTAPSDCPSSYSSDPVCDDASSCTGTRDDATCDSFRCGTDTNVADDSACNGPSDTCGNYPTVSCDGTETQNDPPCASSCTNSTQCDANANCMGGVCVSDGDDGDPCNTGGDCTSGYCNNGFCCDSGTCCSDAVDCPAFNMAPTCDTPATCQGTEGVAVCNASNQCQTNTVNNDSACAAGTGGLGCGLLQDEPCQGGSNQSAPMCLSNCGTAADCDAGNWCNSGVCTPLITQGNACTGSGQCLGGLPCVDGVCCESTCGGLCEACNLGTPGTCQAVGVGDDPASECNTTAGFCTGWFSGWTGVGGDQCYTVTNPSSAEVSCNGARACQQPADLCPSEANNALVENCDDVCETTAAGSCTGQQPPVCTPIPGTPLTQSCGLGVCATTVNTCDGAGNQNTCTPPTGTSEICDGLDNDCDGTEDEEGDDPCALTNNTTDVSCNSTPACEVTTCVGGTIDANNVYSDGCECVPETNSTNSCSAATLATVTETSGPAVFNGNLLSQSDVDWYTVQLSNTGNDGFDVRIQITGPSNFHIRVYKNNCSGNHSENGGTTISCANNANLRTFTFDPREDSASGECNNSDGPNNGITCNSAASRSYRIQVYADAPITACGAYTLRVENAVL